MKTSRSTDKMLEPKADVGTFLTSISLVDVDGFCEALLSDIPSARYDEACRGLGFTHVSYWIQRDPDAVVLMCEGKDTDTFMERFAASPDPFLAKWRGLIRVFAGPEGADSFWDASNHRLFFWESGELGAQSEIRIYREPKQVAAFLQDSLDFRHDPSLFKLYDRVRRSQGFTRIETWHQETSGQDVVLELFEAHDLSVAMEQRAAANNRLDERVMHVERATLLEGDAPMSLAKLLARWNA